MSRDMTPAWRTIDFRPAAPGWRLVWLTEPGPGTFIEALAGWLIEEQVALNPYDYEYDMDNSPSPDDRERRATPATYNKEDGLQSVEDASNFWYVLGPGDPEPSTTDESEERKRRAKHDEWLRELDKKKAAATAAKASLS